jgi:hypothetical protein
MVSFNSLARLFLVGLVLIGFRGFSITFYLSGHLKVKLGSHQKNGHIPVFVTGYQSRVLDQDTTKSNGVFRLSWNESQGNLMSFFCILKKDTLLLGKVRRFESDEPDLTFVIPER